MNHPPQFSGDPSDPDAVAAYADLLSAHARMQRTTHRPQLGIHMHQQHQQQQQHAIPTHPPASAVTPPPLPKAPKTTRAPAAPESGSSKWTFLIIFLLGTAVGFACPDRRAVQLAQHSH